MVFPCSSPYFILEMFILVWITTLAYSPYLTLVNNLVTALESTHVHNLTPYSFVFARFLLTTLALLNWYSRRDSNPHAFRHLLLKQACLPNFHHWSILFYSTMFWTYLSRLFIKVHHIYSTPSTRFQDSQVLTSNYLSHDRPYQVILMNTCDIVLLRQPYSGNDQQNA